jgi:hypothetical protein
VGAEVLRFQAGHCASMKHSDQSERWWLRRNWRVYRPLWRRVRWPLEDDVVGATDGAHNICGETGRRKPVGRVDRTATSAFDSRLNNAGELCLVGQPEVRAIPGLVVHGSLSPIADKNKA